MVVALLEYGVCNWLMRIEAKAAAVHAKAAASVGSQQEKRQLLEVVAKPAGAMHEASSSTHAQATASQARVLAQGRLTRLAPAEKRKHQRERRMSLGLDATLHFEASIEVFKAQGTTDDLVRPENVRG